MMPLMLIIALALISLISSGFVIFRIVVPILPPNPLSRRVPPSEFGLPNYRSMSPADKAHVWLACLDLFALGFFLWQALTENLSTSANMTYDPLSAARLWIALTARQTCLLFIISLTLLYVRLGRPVFFGPKHCFLWAPTLIFVASGTGVGAVLAKVGVATLWGGLVAYSTTVAFLTTACLGGLIGTLLLIRHNVTMIAEAEAEDKEWPPIKEKSTRRYANTEDIEALKEGSSWITSHRSSASSRQNSISAFSFSTAHHSQHGTTVPATGSMPSVLPKSSYWFGTATPSSAALVSQESIPPVPRVPSPYRDRATTPPPNPVYADLPQDPFRRSPPPKSSANSWLTSPSVSQATLTEFSFPTTQPSSTHELERLTQSVLTPATHEHRRSHSRGTTMVQPLSETRVLGGYGRQDGLVGLSPKASKDIDISILRCVMWMTSIWLPLGLSLPYFFMASPTHAFASPLVPILLTLSLTISSPLLALNLILRSPLPIPAALFSRSYSAMPPSKSFDPVSEIRIHPEMHRGRSTSMTVVEGRRSGDIWIANGEAVDGRGKAARVLGLLAPKPRLAVLPPAESKDEPELTPPLPMQEESTTSFALSSPGANSTEVGVARTRKDSKASSYWSGADESLAYKSQIMIAQRHYSAMATTVFIPPSPKHVSGTSSRRGSSMSHALEGVGATSTGIQRGITKSHSRSQSASSLHTSRSSTQHRFPLTPPPSSPLPPTPPNIRHLQHSRSQSSSGSGFSFGPIGHANQIDSLSAGVLPLLVPGLKVSKNMVIGDSLSLPKSRKGEETKMRTPPRDEEFGFTTSTSFNSPEMHSTPARPRNRAGQKWKHLSLPSLGLGKDGVHSLSAWKEELVRVLDGFETKASSSPKNRRTIHGDGTSIPTVMLQKTSSDTLSPVAEDDQVQFGYAVTSNDRRTSVRTFGPTPPTSASVYSDGFNTARSSMVTAVEAPPTSASALLQPTFHDQQEPHVLSHAETKYKNHSYHLPIPPGRKSSIVYIRSDDPAESPAAQTHTDARTMQSSPVHASVKHYIPRKTAPTDGASPLRKLTLLGDRDLNRKASGGSTRPLDLSKKTRRQADKENGGSGLRPLKLARSATAKARGLLRQDEVLPDVVVRPPSMSSHTGFGYTFR